MKPERRKEIDELPETDECEFCPVNDPKVCDMCVLKPTPSEANDVITDKPHKWSDN